MTELVKALHKFHDYSFSYLMILLAICVLVDGFTGHDQQFYAAQVIEVLKDEEAPELGSRVKVNAF